ncbi:unnamed protein product [Nezara viridula]|uniref:C2H2-type domain-containing protein n=1 Tax=Nezara viridula TaxID=85310 RepID=A0A9P0DYE9_NEZVI|nr:unnamed protein product [Nezara viridula]
MADDEVLMEVIVNDCDEVQFYSPADQCRTLYEDKDAMLRTIKEAVKEGVLVLPTVKWDEINSVRFISNVERSVEITSQEVLPETEYQTYEIVEEAPVDETVTSSVVPEEIIIDVGLSSGKELNCHTEHEMLESVNFIDERLNLCPYCDYRTYNVGHFKVHMRQHTGEAPFACEYCPYRSKQKSNLKRHLRQHLEGKDNFECEMCSFTCTKEKVYKRHLKLHQRSRPLRPCPFCDYFSSSLAHLTVHIRQHTGETPYHCGVCQYKTVQKSNLTRHLKKHRHHRVSKADKLRVCAHCNYRTPNSAHLLAHIRAAHTGEAPYSCKHCDYKSAQRSNLKRHMRKHTGERPFSCHLCSYSTAYAYVLKKHIENHPEQDEKFNCDSCDYFTNSSLEFKRHVKTHSGRSMFCCHFCGYISLNADHFKVHLRRHTQEAPYQCHHCDYRSAQRSNLKRHIQTHTEENKWGKDVENSNGTQHAMQSDISVMDVESNEVVDNSQTLRENDIPENVQIIDTTNVENEDVEIYESEEGYVEAEYSPDRDIEEAANVLPESNMEVVGEEHVITTPTEGDYEVYKDCGKIYLCSYCSYQSSSAEDIEAHIQEHDVGSLVNGVEASENETSESDCVKTNNISFLNKSQTEKLKEFKRLLQEGTGGSVQNVVHVTKLPQQQVEIGRDEYYQQPVESVEFRNQPSPEEVTLYGEVEESNEHDGTIDTELKDSSVIIVGTPEELKQTTNECELCGFHARTIWELKSHIRVHTGEMSFVCPQCPFKTNQKYSFQRHVRHLHGWRGNRLPYQCKLCDFRTKNRENLVKHTQNHSKKTPSIDCNICEQTLGSIAELKSHMKIHVGEAPYECFYCGKLTARKLHMRRHMKKHICTMEGKGPPYDCDSCGYQTVFEANYLRHLETHELDPSRAFICHYCRFVTLDNKVFKKHLTDHKNPGSGELDSFVIAEETESDSVNNNDTDDASKHKRKPLREQNKSYDDASEKYDKTYTPSMKLDKIKNIDTTSSSKSKYKSKRSSNSTIIKKREYIRRAGNISESELRIRRRLDFGIKKVPKDPKEGFTIEICGEILKSKRQLRDFSDYGKLIKRSDLDLSTVLEKESHIENMFVPLRESIHALKELKNNSEDNVVTFTIYFKTKDEPDLIDISDNLTDIEAELLSDPNDTDIDSVKSDDELSTPTDLLDGDKNGFLDEVKTSRKELNHNDNGVSSKQNSNRKKLPLSSGIDTIKFFQNKIKERNEKMKQMRRLKVLRNAINWNKNGTKSESINSKNCVQVEYSYSDNVEMEEVVVDHNIDALPSLVS